MPWFIGQHSLGSHRVGFVADQPLIDPVPAATEAEVVVSLLEVQVSGPRCAGTQMVRSRDQLPSLDIGPSHRVRRWEPRKPNGSVLQWASGRAELAKSGVGSPKSAWLVAARPTAVAVIAVASKAPAMPRRRNPIPVTRAVLVGVWWAWLVFAEVFMALIVHPPMAVQ